MHGFALAFLGLVCVAEPIEVPTGASGLLAGQVLDGFNRHPSKVYIQVVDVQDTKAAPARLEVESQQEGYFLVQDLKLGHTYRLIARSKDGNKVLTGTTLATPPNPRLIIYLREDLALKVPVKTERKPLKVKGKPSNEELQREIQELRKTIEQLRKRIKKLEADQKR